MCRVFGGSPFFVGGGVDGGGALPFRVFELFFFEFLHWRHDCVRSENASRGECTWRIQNGGHPRHHWFFLAYPVVQQPQGIVGVAGSTVANFKLVVNVGRGTGQIVFGPRFPKPALAHGCFAEVIVAFQITGNHPMVRHRVVEVVGVDGPNDPAPVPTVAGHSGRPLQPVVPHPDRFHGQSFPSVVTDCIDDGALMLH